MPHESESLRLSENLLGAVRIFRGINAEALQHIAQRCRWRRYAAKTMILECGDLCRNVFFVVQGRVRVTYYSVCGREVAFDDLTDDIFGELSSIDAQPYSTTVLSVTKTLVAIMDAEQFRQIVSENSQLAGAMLGRLAAMVRALENRVIEFSTLSVEKRVYSELLRLAQERGPLVEGAVIAPAPTHAEIASRVSTHREAVTRALSNLMRQGLLQKRRGALVVRDMTALNVIVDKV